LQIDNDRFGFGWKAITTLGLKGQIGRRIDSKATAQHHGQNIRPRKLCIGQMDNSFHGNVSSKWIPSWNWWKIPRALQSPACIASDTWNTFRRKCCLAVHSIYNLEIPISKTRHRNFASPTNTHVLGARGPLNPYVQPWVSHRRN